MQDGAAQRTRATVPLVKEARRAILLSGTPALNRPKELFQQVHGAPLRTLSPVAHTGPSHIWRRS